MELLGHGVRVCSAVDDTAEEFSSVIVLVFFLGDLYYKCDRMSLPSVSITSS